MKLNNKEKYIKQVLENQDSQLSTSALWDAIEGRVPQTEAKPRRRWWILLLPFCLGALVISSIWYYTSQQGLLPTKETSSKLETQNESTSIRPDKVSITNDQELIQNKTTIASQTQTEKSQNMSANTVKSGNENTLKTVNQAITHTGEVPANINTTTQKEITSNVLIQNVATQPRIRENNQRHTLTRTPNNLKTIQTPIALVTDVDSEAKPLIQFVSGIKNLKLKLIYLAQPLLGRLFLSDPTGNEFMNESNAKPTWSVRACSGINLVKSNQSIQENSLLRQLELDNEQNLLGYQGGIGVQRLSANGWSVRSQFGLTTHVTRYQSDEEFIIEGATDSTTEIYNGSSVTEGTVKTFTQVNQEIIWHRSHQQYNLDIIVGRQFDISRKLSILAEVGLLNTLYQTHNGYYFANANRAFTKVTKSTSHPYATGYRLNGALGASLLYNLNNRFSVGLGTSAVLPFELLEDSEYYQSNNSQLRFDLIVGYKLN